MTLVKKTPFETLLKGLVNFRWTVLKITLLGNTSEKNGVFTITFAWFPLPTLSCLYGS